MSVAIHALSVGRGILALSPLPGADGDFRGDMEHIYSWTPAMVVSLTTDLEMYLCQSQAIGSLLQEHGTRWFHMPVDDFGTPDDAFMERWPEVSAFALRALNGGGRVLLHCKGGCGRSGMVVLRLMIESGEDPEAALKRLRQIRPCAVETDAQMAWAVSGRAQAAAEGDGRASA